MSSTNLTLADHKAFLLNCWRQHAVLVIYLASFTALAGTIAFIHFRSQRRAWELQQRRQPQYQPKGGNPPREYGHWIPVDYKRPTASPYPDWDINTTKPLPYRPFRFGTYHVTMGIRSMPWDEWIELDNRYLKFHKLRALRLAERGDKVVRTTPEAYPAAMEMLEELADYLPERYPSLFRRTPIGIDNLATDESFDLTAQPLAEDPMAIAARLVQDDLAIMIERPDGQYYFLSGAILVPGFWRLQDKFGLPLAAIHSAGRGVPKFQTKLKKGMENFFRRATPDKPVIRHNYQFQIDDDLAWSPSLGNEDASSEDGFGWRFAEKDRAVEYHYFRSERQTLWRLPRTGGVVFTIRTYFEKITEIAQEPGVPGRLASSIRGWDSEVLRYKGGSQYRDVLLAYLDQQHQKQVADGLIDSSEEHEMFPY